MKCTTAVDKIYGIEETFADSLVRGDRNALVAILDDKGIFSSQNELLDTIGLSKTKFIDWIFDERKKINELSFYFDRCTFCNIGNPVVIFNNGVFPIKSKDDSEKEKCGLMHIISNNKIQKIDLCYSFLETRNLYTFERKIENDICSLMYRHNCSREEAIKRKSENLF